MNAGLGNLDSLKKHLLAASLGAETRFDQVIQDIGLGVAGMMENFCNRGFARLVNDTATLPADRVSFQLPRYPVEVVSQVEIKMADADAFVVQDMSLIQSTSLMAGLVYFNSSSDAGPYWSQVRFTYTGGFWFETLEPEDDSYPSAPPIGANLLPQELRLAWLLQCRQAWNKIDKLSTGLVDKPDAQSALGTLELAPMVKQMLTNYRSMQLV